MAAIVVSQNTKATWLTGVAGVCAKARVMVRRALGYAAATVLICALGAALAQLAAEILSFPAPIAITAITLIAVALLNSLRRHLHTQPRRRHGPGGSPRSVQRQAARI
jgi:predicted lysophospholipase L1 biosynthesis ABC-type transport system permease subunit